MTVATRYRLSSEYREAGPEFRPHAAAAFEKRSRWNAESGIDLLFALASVASISGLNLPGVSVPIFSVFVVLTTLVGANRLVQPAALHVFIPPLLVFLCIHLAFAFRISVGNGVVFVGQALVLMAFVSTFVARYSQVSMRRYLSFTGIGMVGMLLYVLIYHFSRGTFTSYKLLNDPKAVFNLLPLMLLVLHFNKARWTKFLYPILVPLFITLILMSGERKAYILIAAVAPFLISFRSVGTYVALLALALAVPLGLTFDQSGYVERQLGTLSSFTQGKVDATISNEERASAISFALQLFEENPIIGIGTNGYNDAYENRFHARTGPHNEWLRVAAENGMVGLLFYAATIVWGFVGLFRYRVGSRVRSSREKIVGFAPFLTLVMYLSFEALDLIVLLAFCLAPMVQFLRFDLDPRILPEAAQARYRESVAGWNNRYG